MSDPVLRQVSGVLGEIVADFGRRIADDPPRLRGLLSDALGAEATDCRDSIEAVVTAAALGVPRTLIDRAGPIDRMAVLTQLEQGLDDPVLAGPVCDAWMRALHVQDLHPTDPGITALPPSDVTPPLPVGDAPADPLMAKAATAVPVADPDPTVTPGMDTGATSLPPPPDADAREESPAPSAPAADERYLRLRRGLLLVTGTRAVFAVLTLILLASSESVEGRGLLLGLIAAGLAAQAAGFVGVLRHWRWGFWTIGGWAAIDLAAALTQPAALFDGPGTVGVALSAAQVVATALVLFRQKPTTQPRDNTTRQRSTLRARVTRRRTALIAGTAATLLLAIGVAIAAQRDGSPVPEIADEPDETSAETEVPEPEPLETTVRFPAETTDWNATVQRTWAVADGAAEVTIEIAAPSEEASALGDLEPTREDAANVELVHLPLAQEVAEGVSGSVFEVFLEELGATPDTVTFQNPDELPTHFMNGHAARFVVDLEAGDSVTIAYSFAIPEDVGASDLQDAWQDAMEAFLDAPEPSLTLDEPEDGATVDAEKVTMKGRTDPGARITITGGAEKVKTTADEDGKWAKKVTLVEGANVLKVTTTDLVTTKTNAVEVTVVFEAADASETSDEASDGGTGQATDSSNSNSGSTGSSGSGSTGSSDSGSTDSDAKPPSNSGDGGSSSKPPANKPPTASTATRTVASSAEWTRACVLQNASDPDGDKLTLTSVSKPSVGTARIDGAVSGQSNCNQSVYFEWPSGWSGVATMKWTVSDGKGGTATADLRVTVEASNRAPTPQCSNSTVNLSSYSTSYYFWIATSCFSDPDGDSVTIYANQPSYGQIAAAASCNSGRVCWNYFPPSNWNGAAYTVPVTVYAQDPHGAKSSSITMTLCVNC